MYERPTLPNPTTGFDDPCRLDAFLDAVRWGAVALAFVRNLHAAFQSGTTIEDYQLDPVVRALQMPRVNLLIADDVGLGKTIRPGLVVQELILRNRARADAIPAEIARETAAIRDRYRKPTPRLFPVAGTYLVAESPCMTGTCSVKIHYNV